MKIVIIGADGQLGTDLCTVIDITKQIPLTIKDLDITNISQCHNVLTKHLPDIVINTAAYNKVDLCEENDLEAYKVNANGVKNLALVCREIDSTLVHFSTNYVFDGEKQFPYAEMDTPNPRTAYGISKLAGEYFVKYICKKYYLIRTAGLFGKAGCLGKGGVNFVEAILSKAKNGEELKVIGDEILSPTYTLDLARKVYELIGTNKFGTYHITNKGECSWYDFAKKIFEYAGVEINLQRINSSQLNSKAKRPKYSTLVNCNLDELGLNDLPVWQEALKSYFSFKFSN
jgi:dTDP-4-dehydrorhamnose reductase